MKSVVLLAFVCVAVAQIYPTNYTTVYSNSVVSGSLIQQPADNNNDEYYNGYIPQLFAFDVPTSSQAVFVTLAQTDSNCGTGLLVYVSNYGFPCYTDTEGLIDDICQAVGENIIDTDGGDEDYYVFSTREDSYEGSDDDLQFSFNPGQRLFFSVLRNEEDEDTTNCSFTLNITSVNGCSGNNSVGFGVEYVDYEDTPTYISENDVYCYNVIDLGTVVNTTNTLGYSIVHQNFSGLFRFYLPENVAYVNVSIRSVGSDEVTIYGGPSPSLDSTAYSYVEIQNCPDGCYYENTTATGFFSDIAPAAGAYYVAVYNLLDDFEDGSSTNGISFNLSISVTVCPAGTAGDNCQYNLYPVDFVSLFTTGQQVYAPNGGAVYLYFDISPAYATLSFNLFAYIQDTTSDDNEAYLYINKDKFPLGDGGQDLYIYEYSTFIEDEGYPIVSFSQLDFLGNSGRYYMAVFCNEDNSGSGLTGCNTTFFANFTNVGSNSGLSTGGLTGSTSNSTGTVTSTTVGTSTTNKASTSASSTSKASTSASSTSKASTSASSTSKASTGASSTTGSASSVVPSVIALIAIIAMMF